MTLKILGVDVVISPLFFPLITFLLTVDKFGTALPVIIAMLMHELGHIIAIKAVGQKIWNVKLMPSAVVISFSAYSNFAEDIFVALAGVMANIFALASAIVIEIFFSIDFTYFIAANICIALINLLPFQGLDGGTVLDLILRKHLRIRKTISALFLLLFALGAVYLLKNQSINISALAFLIYIFVATLFKV